MLHPQLLGFWAPSILAAQGLGWHLSVSHQHHHFIAEVVFHATASAQHRVDAAIELLFFLPAIAR